MIAFSRISISHTLKLCAGFSHSQVTIDPDKNYYKILDISANAELSDVKRSFYDKAKQCHPDSVTGKEEEFKLISEAYNVLSNDEYRRKYDIMRPAYTHDHGMSSRKQYANYMRNNYESRNRAEWSRVRRGVRPHERSYQENVNRFNETASEDSVVQFAKKKKMREWRDQQDRQAFFEYLKRTQERDEQYQKKYDQKVEKERQAILEEEKKEFEESIFGKICLNVQAAREKLKSTLWSESKEEK